MDFFELNSEYELTVREDVWVVPEFEAMLDEEFNCEDVLDPNGKNRTKCFSLLKYIYLMYSWKSPNSQMIAKERHELALEQSSIKESWLDDMVVVKAIKAFNKMQETRVSKLLDSVNTGLDKLRIYFDNIDFTELDPMTGKPINTTKDFLANVTGLEKSLDALKKLEDKVKKERQESSALKGDVEAGMFDLVDFK